MSGCNLESSSILQQPGKVILLGLKVRVTSNVLLLDEDVGHGPLVGDFLQGGLDFISVG